MDEILAVSGSQEEKKIDIIDSTRNLLRYALDKYTPFGSHQTIFVFDPQGSSLDRGQLYVQGSVAGLSLEAEQRMMEQSSSHKEEKEEDIKNDS